MPTQYHVAVVNLSNFEAELIANHLDVVDPALGEVFRQNIIVQTLDEFRSAAILTEDEDGEEG